MDKDKIGYDLGGWEQPHDPDTHTIVDNDPRAEIVRDLGAPGWWRGLEPRKEAVAGAVCRYLTPTQIDTFAAGVAEVLAPGGVLTARDHRGTLNILTTALAARRVYLTKMEFLSGDIHDPDWPESEWDYVAEYTRA